MTRFKTLEEFQIFKDETWKCLCGRLATGFHMQRCERLKKEEQRLRKRLRND